MRKLSFVSWVVVAGLWFPLSLLAQSPLKEVFGSAFHVGAAVNKGQILGTDPMSDTLLLTHFDSISPENALKWESVHPQRGKYDFALADAYVRFGEQHHLQVIGHVLVWHKQTPAWVFEGENGKPASREVLLERLRDHIQTVVSRYKGRIHGWDVVNEAIEHDGALRQSPWLKILGEEYIEKAFLFAHEADPSAELYYNDYSLEIPAKRLGAIALIRRLKQKGVPIAAVGLQSHESLSWPSAQVVEDTISDFAKLGVKVNITELDVDVLPTGKGRSEPENAASDAKVAPELNPYPNGLPETVQRALARRYVELFRVFLKHRDAITRVTLWGVTDRDSWLNGWPIRGRSNHPLLFDRQGRGKAALIAIERLVKH